MSEIEIKDGTLSAQLTFDIDISDLIPVADDAIYYSVSHGEGCIIYNSTDSHEDEFFRKCSIASIVDDFIEECTGFSSCIDDFHSLARMSLKIQTADFIFVSFGQCKIWK